VGTVRFLAGYLGHFARLLVHERRWSAAYRLIPHEIEARHEATDWLRRHLGSAARNGGVLPETEAEPETGPELEDGPRGHQGN
jgi:hypothetical protein